MLRCAALRAVRVLPQSLRTKPHVGLTGVYGCCPVLLQSLALTAGSLRAKRMCSSALPPAPPGLPAYGTVAPAPSVELCMTHGSM